MKLSLRNRSEELLELFIFVVTLNDPSTILLHDCNIYDENLQKILISQKLSYETKYGSSQEFYLIVM